MPSVTLPRRKDRGISPRACTVTYLSYSTLFDSPLGGQMKDIFSHLRISFVESAINAQMRALGGFASGDSIDLGLG